MNVGVVFARVRIHAVQNGAEGALVEDRRRPSCDAGLLRGDVQRARASLLTVAAACVLWETGRLIVSSPGKQRRYCVGFSELHEGRIRAR